MKDSSLTQFEYLWTSKKNDYVLLKDEGEDTPLSWHVIYDKIAEVALVIEDDEVYPEVVRRMKDAGVPIVDKLPEG